MENKTSDFFQKNFPLTQKKDFEKKEIAQKENGIPATEFEDPLLLKKQGLPYFRKKDISYYKKLIGDERYMDHAIRRIAMELSHFLFRDS